MRNPFLLIALLLTASSAFTAAADMPKRKSGLWEIKVANDKAKGGHSMEQCIDEKTDELMKQESMGAAKPDCSKNELRREGDKLITEAVCKISGSTVTTRGVFTGKFDSAYKAEIKSSFDPPLHGMRESATTLDAKWLGPCKPGQKAGDISMPGMPNLNMNEMTKRAGKRP